MSITATLIIQCIVFALLVWFTMRFVWPPITVALARKAKRPVRIQNSVDESMVTTRRHGMNAWMRTGAPVEIAPEPAPVRAGA